MANKKDQKKYGDDHPFGEIWNSVVNYLGGTAKASDEKPDDTYDRIGKGIKDRIDPDKAKDFVKGFNGE